MDSGIQSKVKESGDYQLKITLWETCGDIRVITETIATYESDDFGRITNLRKRVTKKLKGIISGTNEENANEVVSISFPESEYKTANEFVFRRGDLRRYRIEFGTTTIGETAADHRARTELSSNKVISRFPMGFQGNQPGD